MIVDVPLTSRTFGSSVVTKILKDITESYQKGKDFSGVLVLSPLILVSSETVVSTRNLCYLNDVGLESGMDNVTKQNVESHPMYTRPSL